jgi:hypothetical protein
MKTIHLILVFTLIAIGGCKDNDKETTDPSQLIVGKWMEIARGNSYSSNPILDPTYQTIEFLADGTYNGPYGFYSGVSDQAVYRIEADSLTLSKEGHSIYVYRYAFTGKDLFRADGIHGTVPYSLATPTFHIYKRIK